MADDVTFLDVIEGYAGSLSYAPGDEVSLHVSTGVEHYSVVIERWGAERVEVMRLDDRRGVDTPAPADAAARGCRWPVTDRVTIPDEWRSGFYLVTMRAHGAEAGRDVAHCGFVLRAAEPAPRRALLVLATNTWNAYNTWGGPSLYTGGTQVSFARPFGRGMLCRPEVDRDDRKARPTRWGEEPDVDGETFQQYRVANGYPAAIGSTGWFSHERRFVEWAEREGIELDYAVTGDLDHPDAGGLGPALVEGYELVLGVGHDEYWSAGQRDTIEAFVAGGGNYASFSGNTMFWQVRAEDAVPSDGDAGVGRIMVCHKYTATETDPVVAAGNPRAMTGMWADPVVDRPEAAFLGGSSIWGLYNRFGAAVARGAGAFTVQRDDHWLFEGTGLRYGDLLGARDGVVGYETLGCRLQLDDFQLPVRAGGDHTHESLEIVGSSPSSNLAMGEYPSSISALSDQGDLEFIAERIQGRVDDDSMARHRIGHAIMAVGSPFGSEGGDVVTIGTTDWVFGLADDPAVGTVTGNVLRRYLPLA